MKVLFHLKSFKVTTLSFLILLLLFAVPSHSQSGWFSQPLPVNGQVQDLKFFDANTGLIAMWQPTVLLRTTNGGYNWDIIISNQSFGDFQIIDSNIVYARGSGYSIDVFLFRSYNRGLTWDSIPVANAWTGNGISFVNRDTGWVGGTAGGLPFLWRTTNAGVTWTVQSTNTGFGKVFFLKQKVNGEYIGWSQTEDVATYKTTNSGVNWFQIQNVGNVKQIYFINENTGWASKGNSSKKTTNGGLTWISYIMPSNLNIGNNFLTTFKVINQDTIFGVGGNRDFGNFSRGIVWISTNGGINWNFQQPDTSIHRGTYGGIDLINKDTGWCDWIRTNDGGGPIIITGINNNITTKPELFILEQNYPNPFNSSTRINFSVSHPSFISLTIYDLTGKELLKVYNNDFFTAGNYYAGIDIRKMGLSSGVYVYRMRASDIKSNNVFEQSRKLVYIK